MDNVMKDTIQAEAATDLSAKQYYVLAQDANGYGVLGTAGTDSNIGVIVDGGRAAGDHVAYTFAGVAEVIAGGNIDEGDAITATTGGAAVATTTANDRCIGYCAQRGGAVANDVFKAILGRFNY